MTHLSLFSGIGGLDLAAEWAGFETVGQCEWADYPTKVLEKHWPDVPRWRDIRTLTGDGFYEQTGLRTVDVISGGFPCQPFSVAGKQKGKEDNRYLWPEMLRVIRELAPRWVIGENVPGILNIAADDVCADLEREGYEVGIFDFEAAAVGAPHRRERIAFVGHSKHNGLSAVEKLRSDETSGNERRQEEPTKAGELAGADRPADVPSLQGCTEGSECAGTVADTDNTGNGAPASGTHGNRAQEITGRKEQSQYGLSRHSEVASNADQERVQGSSNAGSIESVRENGEQLAGRCCDGFGWWAVEPNVGRVANGVPARVDRLKCLGNAVVPQQFYPIFKAIADYEMEAP